MHGLPQFAYKALLYFLALFGGLCLVSSTQFTPSLTMVVDRFRVLVVAALALTIAAYQTWQQRQV